MSWSLPFSDRAAKWTQESAGKKGSVLPMRNLTNDDICVIITYD